MNLVQMFSLSLEALKERRLRAGLTTLMVIMGASLIVSLSGVGNGFTSFVNDQFSTLGANVLILTPRGENIQMDSAFVNELSRLDGVSNALPYIQAIATITSGGRQQSAITVGVENDKLPLLFPTMTFEVGAFVSESDRIGVILGNEVSKADDGSSFAELGQTVKIRFTSFDAAKPELVERSYVVRGLLAYIGSGIVPADQMVFMSTPAANSFFERGGHYDGVYVVTDNPDLNEVARRQIVDKYGSGVIIISPQMIANTISQVTGGVYLFITVIAMVSLLVASVGIITTIQTSMMERIKEIGLLKALGFSRRLILGLFLSEATIIGILGGSTGVLLGMGLSYGMSALIGQGLQVGQAQRAIFGIKIVPLFDPMYLLQTWALCVALSMISGFYPSWQASRLNPVDALRHE